MVFQCVYCTPKGSITRWQGSISLLSSWDKGYEAVIMGRGSSFHVIVGVHQYGKYLCIPGIGVACELSDLSDVFWNAEQLSRRLNRLDVITVTQGVSYLPEFVNVQGS
jgi:hypothetical protein